MVGLASSDHGTVPSSRWVFRVDAISNIGLVSTLLDDILSPSKESSKSWLETHDQVEDVLHWFRDVDHDARDLAWFVTVGTVNLDLPYVGFSQVVVGSHLPSLGLSRGKFLGRGWIVFLLVFRRSSGVVVLLGIGDLSSSPEEVDHLLGDTQVEESIFGVSP